MAVNMHSSDGNRLHRSKYKYSHRCDSRYIGLSGLNCTDGLTAWQNEHVFIKSSKSLFIASYQKDSQSICSVFSVPQWFWWTSCRAFCIRFLVTQFCHSLKDCCFAQQVLAKCLKRDVNILGCEFFNQLLSLRAFITILNVSSFWVSCLISIISMDLVFIMKFSYSSKHYVTF